MLAVAKTDIGLVRQTNEDSFGITKPYLYIVADGMGGHLAGEVASGIAVKTIADYISEQKDGDYESFEAILAQAVEKANQQIYEKAQSDGAFMGMGTTVSIIFICGEKIYWAHVGDSRIYLLRDARLRQITKDHSLVGKLLANGSITKEEARVHPQRNMLTRAVGVASDVKIDTGVEEVRQNDRWLLCTDGLTNMLSDEDILYFIEQGKELQSALDGLFIAALDAGGTDNITAVLIEI